MKLSTILAIVVMGTSLMSPTTEAKDWLAKDNVLPHVKGLDHDSSYAPTYLTQPVGFAQTDVQDFQLEVDAPIDRLSASKAEIAGYALLDDDWDGEGGVAPASAHVRDAFSFLAAMPGGIPIPTPMLSSDGTIGLYWDMDHAYADISFEGNGQFSVFSKNRVTREEQFQPTAHIAEINATWFEDHLGLLRNA